MSKTTKIWLVIAVLLVLCGCLIFGGAMTALQWEFSGLSTTEFETNRYEITEAYKSISIVTDTAGITLAPAEGDKCSVVCYVPADVAQSVAVKNGVLVIEAVDTREWYERIGIHSDSPRITVYIPRGEYGALTVRCDTGSVEIAKDFMFECIDVTATTGAITNYASATDHVNIRATTGSIRIENVMAETMELTVTTGRVSATDIQCEGDVGVYVTTGKTTLTDITCSRLTSGGDTGDISLKNVIAENRLIVERSTGDISLERCDADNISITTDTGDVTGTLCSDKIFDVETDTGRVQVPDSFGFGVCEIITDTGDIKIRIEQ